MAIITYLKRALFICELKEFTKTVRYKNDLSQKKEFKQFSLGDKIVYQNDKDGTPIHKRAGEVCRTGIDGMKYCFNPKTHRLDCDINGKCKIVEK